MRRIILMFAAAFAVACSSDSTNSTAPVSTTPNFTGVWNLATINGQGVPALLGQNDTAKVELLSGSVTLATNGNFVDEISVRVTLPSGVKVQGDTIRGSYSMSGSSLTMQPGDGSSPYLIDITDSNTLTESDPGFLIVYHRR
jgi:hypothetical protein